MPRKRRSTRDGRQSRTIQVTATIRKKARIIPINGARTMNNSVFVQPATRMELHPALAMAAPP